MDLIAWVRSESDRRTADITLTEEGWRQADEALALRQRRHEETSCPRKRRKRFWPCWKKSMRTVNTTIGATGKGGAASDIRTGGKRRAATIVLSVPTLANGVERRNHVEQY